MELILPPLWTGQILTQAKSSICVGNWLWSRHVQLSEGTEQSLLHWPILFNQPILCQWKIKIETTPRWKHTMNPLYLCPITSAKRKRSLQPQHYQKAQTSPQVGHIWKQWLYFYAKLGQGSALFHPGCWHRGPTAIPTAAPQTWQDLKPAPLWSTTERKDACSSESIKHQGGNAWHWYNNIFWSSGLWCDTGVLAPQQPVKPCLARFCALAHCHFCPSAPRVF